MSVVIIVLVFLKLPHWYCGGNLTHKFLRKIPKFIRMIDAGGHRSGFECSLGQI